MSLREVVPVIIAALFAMGTVTTILNGNLKQGLTPGWVDFATANPVMFGGIVAVLALVFGGGGAALMIGNG
jgi:hypothetical protein